MTLVELLRLARANLLHLLLLTAVGGLFAYGYASRIPPTYAADASGYVVVGKAAESTGDVVTNTSVAGSKAESYLPLVRTRAVAERAGQIMGSTDDASTLAARITGTVEPQSVMLRINATGPSPDEAQRLADAAIQATAYVASTLENGGTAPKDAASGMVKIIPIENAMRPGAPIAPDLRRFTLAGVAVGLGVAVVLVFLRRHLDTRVRTVSDVEDASGSTVLGVVPATPELRRAAGRGRIGQLGGAAEAFRQLRTNLRFISVDAPPRSIVVTSAGAGEGKSTISSTLARVLGEAGEKVVIIDADLRRSTLARVFELHGSIGLSQVLSGQVDVSEALQETEQVNVTFLAAGRVPPNPSELLGSQRMQQLIADLSEDHLVILDAPPLLPVTDAGLLSGTCDGTVLVFAIGKTHKEQIQLCAKTLKQVGGKTIGCVINLAPRKSMGQIVYGYGSGYSSYRSDYETADKYVGSRAARPERKGLARIGRGK